MAQESFFGDPSLELVLWPHQQGSPGVNDVLTQLNGNDRTGAYLHETRLTPNAVALGDETKHFGPRVWRPVDGQVLAQPLYLADFQTLEGRRNLVIVATATNMIYAFDADDLDRRSSGLVFSRRVQPSTLNPTPVDICQETFPRYVGITSTPVIDREAGVIYVVAYDPEQKKHFLHKLDLHNDFADAHPAVEVAPPALPSDVSLFYGNGYRSRAGLLLLNGVVYVALTSATCDHPYEATGWVLGFSADHLNQVASWRPPGNPHGAAIWQSGRGLVGTQDGHLYFMTGNDNAWANDRPKAQGDPVDPLPDASTPLANSFIRLRVTGESAAVAPGDQGLALDGWFTPSNTISLSKGDTDLGASGPLLLPGGRLIGGGKQGRVYVLDANTMNLTQDTSMPDHFEGFEGFVNTYHDDRSQRACNLMHFPSGPSPAAVDRYCRDPNSIDNRYNERNWPAQCNPDTPTCYLPHSCYQFCQGFGPNLHAGFVYWPTGRRGGLLYAMPEKEHLKAFRYDAASRQVGEVPVRQSTVKVPDGMPGAALGISANGTRDGIVWASMPLQKDATNGIVVGRLVAFDATDLHVVYDFKPVCYFSKFNPPIIADHKIFLATSADPGRPARDSDGSPSNGFRNPPPLPPSCIEKDPSTFDEKMEHPPGTAWLLIFGFDHELSR